MKWTQYFLGFYCYVYTSFVGQCEYKVNNYYAEWKEWKKIFL